VQNGFYLVQCPSCGLAYVGNPPSKAEIKRSYSFDSGYHSTFADENSPESRLFLELGRQKCALLQRYKSTGRILDVGCSAGFFLKACLANGWETYGVELSQDTADIAMKRYGLSVTVGSLEETDFPSEYFDAVTLWDVLEHVEYPMQTLSEVHRLLRPGGVLGLTTPNISGLFPRMTYNVAKLIHFWPHPAPPGHLFQFSKSTLLRSLEQNSFVTLDIIDERIPLSFLVGHLGVIWKSPRRMLYLAAFGPFSFLGPLLGSGDSMTVFAKKRTGDAALGS